MWQLVGVHPHQARRRELHRHLLGAYGKLPISVQADALLDAVEELLIHRHRVRAPSRDSIGATFDKGVTQGFRSYFNLSTLALRRLHQRPQFDRRAGR